jgi:hypothetical protein
VAAQLAASQKEHSSLSKYYSLNVSSDKLFGIFNVCGRLTIL